MAQHLERRVRDPGYNSKIVSFCLLTSIKDRGDKRLYHRAVAGVELVLSYPEFIFAIVALLLTPGPTNTLLALGAASRGLRASLPMVAAELSAYLIVVIPFATLAATWLSAYPMVALTMKAAAAIWVFTLAVKLWLPNEENKRPVSAAHVFVTTLLNPKAIIIGLVIMPHGQLTVIAPQLALLAGLIVFASLSWLSFGAFALGRSGVIAPATMRRIGALVLAGFSLMLTSSVLLA